MEEIDKSNIIRDKLIKSQTSPLKMYKELTAGNVSFGKFLYYEIVTSLFGAMPGGLGYFLRKKFFPRMFKKVGRGVIIGRNVVFRHPHKIELGDFVTIDDYCLIDGRAGDGVGVSFGDSVLIGRNCMIIAKVGSIKLGNRVSLGANSVIVSMAGVDIGEAVLTAGHCSISAGLFNFDDLNTPVMDQIAYSKGPIKIGKYSWLGTGVIILDGVTIGDSVVIGASSMVNKDIPECSIAMGTPAKVVKSRKA